MTQHTPGPWRWDGDSFDDVEPHLCPHATSWTDHGPDLIGANGETVLMASGHDSSSLKVTKADAQLIAVAPDLYQFVATRATLGDEAAIKLLEVIHDTTKGN